MRYWKHLELDNFLTTKRKALQFISADPVVQGRKVFSVVLDVNAFNLAVPELNESLASYGVHAIYIAAIVVNVPKIVSIHIDAGGGPQARLQLPLMNTIGTRTLLFMNEHHSYTPIHYDWGQQDEFVWIPLTAKRFFVFDEKTDTKHQVTGKMCTFNNSDYHGSDPSPYAGLSLRVDGVFTDDFRQKLKDLTPS